MVAVKEGSQQQIPGGGSHLCPRPRAMPQKVEKKAPPWHNATGGQPRRGCKYPQEKGRGGKAQMGRQGGSNCRAIYVPVRIGNDGIAKTLWRCDPRPSGRLPLLTTSIGSTKKTKGKSTNQRCRGHNATSSAQNGRKIQPDRRNQPKAVFTGAGNGM